MAFAAMLLVLASAGAETFAEFGPEEGWQVWWPSDRGPAPFSFEGIPESASNGFRPGLRLVVRPRANPVDLVLFAPSLRSTLFAARTDWEIEARADGPAGVRLWPNVLDRRGRGFVYPDQAVVGSETRLRFPASDRRFGWGPSPTLPPEGELNLHEITVRVPASSQEATILLRSVRVTHHGKALSRLATRLFSEDPMGLHHRRPGDPTPVRIMVRGVPLSKVTGTATTKDWTGKTISTASLGGRLDDRGRLVVSLDPKGPLGLRNVHLRLQDGDGRKLETRHTYAVFSPVPPVKTPDFEFGLQGDDREKWIHAAAHVGASLFRTGVDFREIRPDPTRPYDFSKMDARIALIRKLGMRPQGLIAYGIPWATPERHHQFRTLPDGRRERLIGWPEGFIYPVEEAPWREFVRAVAERYRGQIPIYEIWNEPDITVFYRGSTAEYLAMLRQASEEIRRADPTALVGTGGFAFPPFEKDVYGFGNPGLQEAVLRDASKDFDVHILHLHGDYASFRWGYENSVLPLRKRLGTRQPILFNETAYSEHLPERELIQAAELVKKFTYAWSRGATGLVWFRLWMSPQDTPGEYGYSMFRGEADVAEPKAVWPAYAALARTLRGHTFLREVNLGPGIVAFLFRDRGGLTLYHWRQDATASIQPIALRLRAAHVRSIDLMGNGSMVATSSGIVQIVPTDLPTALRIEGPQPDLRILGPLVSPGAALRVPAEVARTEVPLRLWNPTKHAQHLHPGRQPQPQSG